MVALQKNTEEINFKIPKEFKDNLALIKVDSLDKEMDELSKKVAEIENKAELWSNSIYQMFFSLDERQRESKAKKENVSVIKDSVRECEKIVGRTLEILSDWSETQDIQLQIQYAAVICGKIDKMKKTDFIQSNNTRKKICTLLRLVIRINSTDSVFTEEQMILLKKGFELLLCEQIENKDMLQLNREFLQQGLSTMPAWE